MSVSTSFPAIPESAITCHTAHFATQWPNPSTAIVTVDGEIDAVNAIAFVDHALRDADRMRDVVIDLTGVTFFGSAGFAALHTLNVRCASAGIGWEFVPGKAVSRLLRICDPESSLPVRRSVETAAEAPRRLLQLVAQSS
jgi:anti-anti-sigma factor